ncbi:DUF4249 domain-containing protein [Larkinella bovis]|uniref:DUF4249 domain-containing protein n=1 Tax=Larkinella bovis TaxID=683041 RepID=A0ABW0I5W9_9BACT
MLFRLFFLFVLLNLGTGSCISPYQPTTQSIGPALVVEGMITDQPGPYVIKLTQTSDYSYKALNLLVTGAIVTISDDRGNQETLKEVPETGQYQTSRMQGVVGRRYQVSIRTSTGKQYESDLELLKAAVPVQKLYYQFRADPYGLKTEETNGWDVYVDTKDAPGPGDYYRWVWTHYNPISVCNTYRPSRSDTIYSQTCCSPCWDIVRCANCLTVRSDAAINGQTISGQFITRVPYSSTARYYLEVEQQAISLGAYRFFDSVHKLTSGTGGLFDAAPAAVRGNIRCTSHPDELVFGYFGAAGVSVQAISIDRSGLAVPPTLPPAPIFKYNPPDACFPCANGLIRTTQQPRWW